MSILIFSAVLAICGWTVWFTTGNPSGIGGGIAGTVPLLAVWWLIWASNRKPKDRGKV